MFSHRVPSDLAPNRLSEQLARLRVEKRPIIDLTESNPTRAGLTYPSTLLAPLGEPASLVYAPEPFGLLAAREAIAADYARRGIRTSPDRIALTASTSEAYSLLFKVLCDPGDEVLVPRPSYPLFEHLTRLDAVVARPYDLEYGGSWSIDIASVERALSDRTRALLVVHPNNPTGSFVKRDELAALGTLCAARGVALVADEVFADYELTPGARAEAGIILEHPPALTFSLGGLSKTIGLPQAKLGWIGLAGPDALVTQTVGRLEIVCDAYLSVSTPVQGACGRLLDAGTTIRQQIQRRVAGNYETLLSATTSPCACRTLLAEGGWYAVLHVPTLGTEEDLVLDLLSSDHVLVHPGYFFDFPGESYLVLSLLVEEAAFSRGVDSILRHFDCSMWPA